MKGKGGLHFVIKIFKALNFGLSPYTHPEATGGV